MNLLAWSHLLCREPWAYVLVKLMLYWKTVFVVLNEPLGPLLQNFQSMLWERFSFMAIFFLLRSFDLLFFQLFSLVPKNLEKKWVCIRIFCFRKAKIYMVGVLTYFFLKLVSYVFKVLKWSPKEFFLVTHLSFC